MVYSLNCPLMPANPLHVFSVRRVRSLYAPPCLHSSSGAPPWLGSARRGLLCVPTASLSAQAWTKSGGQAPRRRRHQSGPTGYFVYLYRQFASSSVSQEERRTARRQREPSYRIARLNIGSILSNSPVEVVFVNGVEPFKLAVAEDVGLGCPIAWAISGASCGIFAFNALPTLSSMVVNVEVTVDAMTALRRLACANAVEVVVAPVLVAVGTSVAMAPVVVVPVGVSSSSWVDIIENFWQNL